MFTSDRFYVLVTKKKFSSSKPQHNFIYNNLLQTTAFIAFKISFRFSFFDQTRNFLFLLFTKIYFFATLYRLTSYCSELYMGKKCAFRMIFPALHSKFSFFAFRRSKLFFLCSHNSCHIHENTENIFHFFLHSFVCVFVRVRDTLCWNVFFCEQQKI